jgi:mRNA interferase MazF
VREGRRRRPRGLSWLTVCRNIGSIVNDLDEHRRDSTVGEHHSHPANAPHDDATIDGVPRCGGVYWVEVDTAGGVAPNYRHPHVVIQSDVLNQSRIHTVIVCAVSTNLMRATEPGNVRLEQGEGNLERPSVVIVSQISSIQKTQLGAWLGMLSKQRVEQIFDGLRFQQRSHFHGR